jgi:SulP family sulfate permease
VSAPATGRLGRLLPGIAVARSYDRTWLRGDVLGGLTVAAYLIPQVMAYAEVAGMPAVAGLWATAPALLLYAILGSSRQLSIGPESTTALMTAAGVGALVATAGPDRYREVAALLALAVGAICLLGWLTRLGFLAGLLSKPVLAGYMAGIAAFMIVSQLGKVTRIEVEGDSFVGELRSTASQLGEAHGPTLLLAVVVLAVLVAFACWAPRWPGPLIAMLGSAAVVYVFDLADHGIGVVGTVPQGLPSLVVPRMGDLELLTLLPAAIGVAVVAYSDNVLTGRAFANKRRERLDANQEFLALGSANVAAGLFQGFPVSSSGSRTALGSAMGSRTQLHSLVALVLLIATLLWFGPVLSNFPAAALGAIVVYAALRLIDITEFKRIAAFRGSELILALTTTAAVLLLGVLPGIGVAIGLSTLDLLRRIVHPHDGVLGYVPGLAGMHDIDDYPTAEQVPGLVVYRYDSPLFFANADDFVTRASAAVIAAEATGTVEWFLLNAEANTEIDLTAIDALDDLRIFLTGRGITFAMARVKDDLRTDLESAGFLSKVGDHLIYPTLPTAVQAYVAAYEARHGEPPPGLKIPPPPPAP